MPMYGPVFDTVCIRMFACVRHCMSMRLCGSVSCMVLVFVFLLACISHSPVFCVYVHIASACVFI